MRKFTFLVGFLFLSVTGIQAQRTCSTMDHFQHLKDTDPAAEKNHQKYKHKVNEWIRENGNQHRAGGVITIPTVVHVIYRTSAENISNAEIMSQMTILNEDFRKQNADTSNIPAVWANTMGDSEIEFCLAQRDPQGNPTTGILRVPTTVNSFGFSDNMKYTSSGGSDAWPRDQYLNIWVCNLGGGLLGFAQFPGQAAATDGVAVGYQFFGNIGSQAPFNLGRTTTHEVGHWLGLEHIWGGNGCANGDGVADTPPQNTASGGCPSFPATDNCSPSSPGYMFMNYMDYSDDGCMNSFTVGQGNVMQGVLATTRVSLQSSNGCVPVNLLPNDASLAGINSPSGSVCAASITPEFDLFNNGQNTITSIDVNWQIDAGTVMTQAWTGSLASLATTTITLPSQAVAPGNHDITIWTTNPNGVSDDDPTNDTMSVNFTLTTAPAGTAPPLVETFETGNFPPAGWSINNPDNAETWELFSSAGANNSSRSARMNYFDYAAPGEIDELVLPSIDLSSAPAPVLTFDVSYSLYSQTGFSDTLTVYVSTDCGASWTSVYQKFDQALTTVSPFFTTNQWVPTTSDHWRNEYVDLSAYANTVGVQIKFVGGNDYENDLYIDNVNVLGFVGVEGNLPNTAVTLSPNPGHDQFRLDINLPVISEVEISVVNSIGQKVWETSREEFNNGRVELDLSGQSTGIYFVRVKTSSGTTTKKLIRQ